jgi:hypothetical protein
MQSILDILKNNNRSMTKCELSRALHCNVGDLNGMLDQKVMEGEIDLIPVTKRGRPPSVLVQMHTGVSMTKNQPTVILNPGEDASVDADEAGASDGGDRSRR